MVQEFTTDEGIPLTEDVIKEKPREFIKTWLEWIPDGNVEQISKSFTPTLFPSILYEVPKGHTLFLTNAFLSYMSGGAGAGIFFDVFLEVTFHGKIISFGFLGNQIHNDSVSRDFNMPLRVEEGSKITINLSAAIGLKVYTSIMGFLLPKKISFR